MFSEVRKRVKKAGLPPGTPTYTGSKKNVETQVTVVSYDLDSCNEIKTNKFEDCLPLLEKSNGVSWINVEGLTNIKLIEELTQHFNIHPLTVEDILNVEQRPKVEEFAGYVFVTLKALHLKKGSNFSVRQLSLIMGKNFLLSFEEFDSSRFDVILNRLKTSTQQRMREQNADYLLYRLIDLVVDEYFVVLEVMGEKIEVVEDRIISDPTPQNARTIYRLKRQMLMLRKAIWPMREALSHLMHNEEMITKFTRLYLRDVYDHTVQAIDTIETFRDILASMLDMYLSSLTNRMNEIMKTLTIITTIFIPITAIASIYGMNFVSMPGLSSPYGFYAVMIMMLMVGIIMMIYFRKKKWF